jgi:hypothetical protein
VGRHGPGLGIINVFPVLFSRRLKKPAIATFYKPFQISNCAHHIYIFFLVNADQRIFSKVDKKA